jgi:hypothetical protein
MPRLDSEGMQIEHPESFTCSKREKLEHNLHKKLAVYKLVNENFVNSVSNMRADAESSDGLS